MWWWTLPRVDVPKGIGRRVASGSKVRHCSLTLSNPR